MEGWLHFSNISAAYSSTLLLCCCCTARVTTHRHAELQRSIRMIASGNAVFDSDITDTLSSLFNRMQSCYPSHHFPELTHRENEVLTFVAQGLKNRQIAAECEITEKTVRNHVTNILSKLGATSRGEAISRLQQSCPSF